MGLNDVQRAYEESISIFTSTDTKMIVYIICFLIVYMVITGLFMVAKLNQDVIDSLIEYSEDIRSDFELLILPLVSIIYHIIIVIVSGVLSYFLMWIVLFICNDNKELQVWEKDYLQEYLNKEPLNKYEILSISTTKDEETPGYTKMLIETKKEKKSKKYKIVYKKDGDVKEYVGKLEIKYGGVEEAEFSYRELNEGISKRYPKGNYKMEVRVPKGYKIAKEL